MENKRIYFAVAGTVVILTTVIFYLFPSDNTSYAQTNPNEVTWEREPISISSNDLELAVILPDLESSSDYIVGVVPTGPGESEEIVIGVVSWTDALFGNSVSVKRISSISNYPVAKVSEQAGLVEIDEDNGLFAGDESLIVYAKVDSETQLTVEKGDETLAQRPVEEGFILHKGVPISMKATGPAGLLMQLQTNQLARSAKSN